MSVVTIAREYGRSGAELERMISASSRSDRHCG